LVDPEIVGYKPRILPIEFQEYLILGGVLLPSRAFFIPVVIVWRQAGRKCDPIILHITTQLDRSRSLVDKGVEDVSYLRGVSNP